MSSYEGVLTQGAVDDLLHELRALLGSIAEDPDQRLARVLTQRGRK